MNINRDSTDSI